MKPNPPLPNIDDKSHSQFTLLIERRFWPLFVTQFLGAFNDNAYKNALLMLSSFGVISWFETDMARMGMEAKTFAILAGGLLILPFFLFSATAGQLADKFDKAKLARATKMLEIFIVLLAGLGFWLHNLPVLLSALFLLGLQSTLFGPVKYSILPQHLHADELVGGNALVEAGTFVAILIGTLAGGLLASQDNGTVWIFGICLLVAVIGFLASCRIPAAPAPAPELNISINIVAATWRGICFASQERSVFQSILGISWFWAYGSLLLVQLPDYTKTHLNGNSHLVMVLFAVFSVAIGTGSLICEKLTRLRGKAVEPGIVPVGALGMTIFGLDLALGSPAQTSIVLHPLNELLRQSHTWRVLLDLTMMGVFGGIYCVPLYALIQQRSSPEVRARIIAANNILNSLFMVLISAGAFVLLKHGISIPTLFLSMALLHGIVTAYIFSVVPEFLIRAMVWMGWRRES
ncbi:MAG: MFS transporter [Azoarcus sp.]|jgi:MFS family permease|nr:MFS transporter [Azoarcus sp.]